MYRIIFVWIDHYTHAAGHTQFHTVIHIGLGNNGANFFTDFSSAQRSSFDILIEYGKHYHKFITTQTSNQIFFAHRLLQTFCNYFQYAVTNRMTEGIINGFELVEIDKQHRTEITMALCAAQFVFKALY